MYETWPIFSVDIGHCFCYIFPTHIFFVGFFSRLYFFLYRLFDIYSLYFCYTRFYTPIAFLTRVPTQNLMYLFHSYFIFRLDGKWFRTQTDRHNSPIEMNNFWKKINKPFKIIIHKYLSSLATVSVWFFVSI
jgi:hypothetical protein